MTQFRDHADLHPSEGARFLFERASVSEDRERAAYDVAVFTREERFEYRVDMRIDGSFDIDPRGAEVADELGKKLRAIAKLIARAAAKKQADRMPPWPHRVLRWRGPGR